MNRGSLDPMAFDPRRLLASMRPRFMNRGSPEIEKIYRDSGPLQ